MDTQNDFLDNAVNDELDIGQEVDMQSQMCSYLHDDMDENCSLLQSDTCGDGDNAPKEKYLKLLEFRHFERHILFSQSERKDKKKAISNGVNVQVVVRV